MRKASSLSWILLFSLLEFLFRSGEGQASANFDVGTLPSRVNINDYGRVLLENDNRSFDEMNARLETEGLKISDLLWGGYRDGFYWVRLLLANESAEAQTVHLITANRLTYYFEYFIPDSEQKSQVRIKRVRASIPTLELTLPPGQKLRLIMKLKFGLQDTVSFYVEPPPPAADDTNGAPFNIQEMAFGVIIGMIFLNICLSLLTREIIFFLHAVATGMVFWAVFLLSGLTYHYFNVDEWNRFLPVAGCFGVAANNAFGQVYLETRHNHPRIHLYFNIGLVIGIIGGVLLALGASKTIIYFTDVNLLAIVIIGLATAYLFPPSRHRVMRFYIIGWMGLAGCVLIWLASEYGILKRSTFTENAMTLGLAFELIIVSLGLADQINHYKNTLSNYNRNLEQTIEEKTRDIRSIMEYIPMGVFMIKSDNRIHKDHSQLLEDILPVQELETNPATEILFGRFEGSSDDKSQAMSTIMASLGENIINFEVNAHMLPRELRDRENRIWDLTWNPIEDKEGRVEKILVTMREVTEMRTLLEHNQAQQEELEIIGEIIAVPAQRFVRFVRSTRTMLEDNAYLLSHATDIQRDEVIKLLFINAHTIKGAARSLYFRRMTRMLHDMEQSYAELQKHPEQTWDLERMQQEITAILQLLDQYETMARLKLGRNLEQSRSVELSIEQAEQGYFVLKRAIQERTLTDQNILGLDQMRSFLHRHVFRSARDVFTEIGDCLPTLARDLHKEQPTLELQVDGFFVKDQAEEVLRNIFLHLLRNSMDHGIETAEERLQGQKPRHGLIRIGMKLEDRQMLVTCEDDGRGLNLAGIRELALARKLLSVVESRDPLRVAELIFDAGLSTARHVTDISGRGIGMNAVRRFAHEHDGEVSIHLGNEYPQGSGYYQFQFHIVLPRRFFEADPIPTRQSVA
ncbi:7TM diverse intracellular signaling domain-containing protein [Oligoflexus tunisiensis]|uniref:7TM diverse intracellular signaling domain-containing protein n=1 Tax=Oligoflexus tunisiensis TaxID=708132 RepID=UPI000AF5837A|nr:7TM diverse intracellular signaling domain-containing protein [Oligoflexus tunisiensis]